MLGLSIETIIVIAAASAVFLFMVSIVSLVSRDDRLVARVRAVTTASNDGVAVADSRTAKSNKAAIGIMRQIVNQLNLVGTTQAKNAAKQLARAGWRSKDALIIYYFFRLVIPIFSAGASIIAFYALELFEISSLFRLLAVVVCTVCGYFAPIVFVKNIQARRREKLLKAVPDTVDLMVICTEAGLSLDATFDRVAREVAPSAPVMADEISVLSTELAYLGERREAMENFYERVGLPAIQALTTTLLQTEKFGTPVGHALRVLAQETRDQRMLRAEEKAARLPALMTVPLITCIMPALFVVVMGPAVLSIMDSLGKF